MDATAAIPTGTKSLAIATLIINLILIQPVTFILWKHGKRGLLGWLYLQLLCVIRVIGNGIEIHVLDTPNSDPTVALVLSSVGLSPLLLAAAGVLHEARRIRNPEKKRRWEWTVVIQYHLLVSTCLMLVVIGVVNLSKGTMTSTLKVLMRVGAAGVVVCYVLLAGYIFLSYLLPQRGENSAYNMGTKLLHALILSLPFIAIRVGYAVANLIIELQSPDSSFLTSVAVKVFLSLIPEVLVILIFVEAGMYTQNINRVVTEGKKPEYAMVGSQLRVNGSDVESQWK